MNACKTQKVRQIFVNRAFTLNGESVSMDGAHSLYHKKFQPITNQYILTHTTLRGEGHTSISVVKQGTQG